MAKLDRDIQKLLDDIEAEVEYLILVEMMKEAWEELRKEPFGTSSASEPMCKT